MNGLKEKRITTSPVNSCIHTTLYELVETIGTVTGTDVEKADQIIGIMVGFGNRRQIRFSKQRARIEFVSPARTNPA